MHRALSTFESFDFGTGILRHGCRVNGRDPDHYFPVGTTIIVAKEEEEFKMNTMSSLFLPKWRWMVISMLIIWAFLDFM